MRRTLLVIAVALVMAAMVVASALPALAAPGILCGQDDRDEFGPQEFSPGNGAPLVVSTPRVCEAPPHPI